MFAHLLAMEYVSWLKKGVLDVERNPREMSRLSTLLLLLFGLPLLVTLVVIQASAQQMPTWNDIPYPASARSMVLSPDGNHVAFVNAVDGKETVVVDGKPGKAYAHIRAPWKFYDTPAYQYIDEVPGIFFSPDGSRVAYVVSTPQSALRQSSMAVVVDGTIGQSYDEVTLPTFSSDGKHLAYGARSGKNWRVVLDGVEGKVYPELGIDARKIGDFRSLVFSPDSSRMGYLARTADNKWHAVVDSHEGPAYDRIEKIVFSPDSRHFACVAQRGREYVMVFDGREGASYVAVEKPVFSPDSSQFAYIAYKGIKARVIVVNGQEQPEYGQAAEAVFSPDSRHLAVIAAGWGGPCKLIVDGVVQQTSISMSNPFFSFDPNLTGTCSLSVNCLVSYTTHAIFASILPCYSLAVNNSNYLTTISSPL